jgi:hypothetical protein
MSSPAGLRGRGRILLTSANEHHWCRPESLRPEDVFNNMSLNSLLAQGDSPVKVHFVMTAGVLALTWAIVCSDRSAVLWAVL